MIGKNKIQSAGLAPPVQVACLPDRQGFTLLNTRKANLTGFTLIEIVVSVAIFSVLILSATTIFQRVLEGQRLVIASQNTQESLRFAMELLSKEVRTARVSSGTCSVTSGKVFAVSGSTLYFKNQYDECVTYTRDSNRFKITRDASSAFITPDEINVSDLTFIVQALSATKQPMVTIAIGAYNQSFGTADLFKSRIDLQTTISSRSYAGAN